MTPKNIFSSNSKDHDDESFHVEEKEGVTAVVYGSKNLQQKKWWKRTVCFSIYDS